MQVLLECCCIYKWKVHNGKIEIISFVVKICTFVLNLFLFIRYVLSSIIDMTITGTAYQSPAPGFTLSLLVASVFLIRILCCIFSFVCLCSVSCTPNVASFSGYYISD